MQRRHPGWGAVGRTTLVTGLVLTGTLAGTATGAFLLEGDDPPTVPAIVIAKARAPVADNPVEPVKPRAKERRSARDAPKQRRHGRDAPVHRKRERGPEPAQHEPAPAEPVLVPQPGAPEAAAPQPESVAPAEPAPVPAPPAGDDGEPDDDDTDENVGDGGDD